MKTIRAYGGKVLDDPKAMTTQQLKAYCKWVEEYLEWCLDADGRVSSYDRMSNSAQPYFEERDRRNCSTCGSPDPKKHPATSRGGEVQPCRNEFHKVEKVS